MRNELSAISPFEALPFHAQEAVTTVAQRFNCNEDLVALTYIGATAQMLLGTTCRVEEGYIVPSSLYITIGAKPSSGKTPVVALFKELIDDILKAHWFPIPEEAAKRASIVRTLEAREKGIMSKAKKCDNDHQRLELAAQLNEIGKKIAANKPILPFEIGNTTIQALPQELEARNGIGYIFDAEGGILPALETVSTNQLRSLLSAWSMEPISEITKKRNISVTRPFLTMSCLWQIEKLISVLLSPKYKNVGLTARFLPLIVDQSSHASTVSDHKYCDAISLIKKSLECIFIASKERLHSNVNSPTFTLASNGASKLKHFRDELQDSRLCNSIPEFTGKADLHAVRLAIVLSALQKSKTDQMINTETLTTACKLTAFFAQEHIWVQKNADSHEMLTQTKPLLPHLQDLYYEQAFKRIYTEDLAKPSGLSNKKCEKILHWLEREGYLRTRYMYSNLHDTQWEPTRRFEDLLLEHL